MKNYRVPKMIFEREISTRRNILFKAMIGFALALSSASANYARSVQERTGVESNYLWDMYSNQLKNAKYIDLTHAFAPTQPVWPGFAKSLFKPSIAGRTIDGFIKEGEEFDYKKHGFIATAYDLTTDQYGTQLDPPAHWNPLGATISDLPATFTLRPLVVINIADKVKLDEGYHLQISDILEWEERHGRVPEGSVVMVRSDWYKKWEETERFASAPFPGVSLAALKLLHLERRILFHGHEPLDTDGTPNLEGEYWLMHNNFAQVPPPPRPAAAPPASRGAGDGCVRAGGRGAESGPRAGGRRAALHRFRAAARGIRRPGPLRRHRPRRLAPRRHRHRPARSPPPPAALTAAPRRRWRPAPGGPALADARSGGLLSLPARIVLNRLRSCS